MTGLVVVGRSNSSVTYMVLKHSNSISSLEFILGQINDLISKIHMSTFQSSKKHLQNLRHSWQHSYQTGPQTDIDLKHRSQNALAAARLFHALSTSCPENSIFIEIFLHLPSRKCTRRKHNGRVGRVRGEISTISLTFVTHYSMGKKKAFFSGPIFFQITSL